MALCGIASAALASYGCTLDTAGSSGCDGFVPMDTEIFISGAQACAIAAEGHVSSATTPFTPLAGPTCNTICNSSSTTCTLPDNVLQAYLAGQAGAVDAGGALVDAAPDGGEAAAGAETGSSDAGNAGGSSAPACSGTASTAPIPMICTSTCGQ